MYFYLNRDEGKDIVGPAEFLAEIKRIVYIGDIADTSFGPSIVVAPYNLLALNEQDHSKPIRLLIDSGGGYLQLFLFVYDVTIEGIEAPVYTMALGRCYSAAVLPFIAGKKGKRFCLPHTEFILHFPFKVGSAKSKTEKIFPQKDISGPEKPEEDNRDNGNVLYVPMDEWKIMRTPEKIPVKRGEDISKKIIKNILRTHLKSDKVEDVIKRLEESKKGRLNIYSEEAVEVGIADKILTKKNRDEFFS